MGQRTTHQIRKIRKIRGKDFPLFIGAHYEWHTASNTGVKYYYAGAQRVAMNKDSTLSYFLSDHLGSTSLVLDSSGGVLQRAYYDPFGTERFETTLSATNYTYTGQYSYTDDFGLMYYSARFYSPELGRFSQADTIIPGAGNPMAWDRYAYAQNNALKYNDPSGHTSACAGGPGNAMAGAEDCAGYKPTRKPTKLDTPTQNHPIIAPDEADETYHYSDAINLPSASGVLPSNYSSPNDPSITTSQYGGQGASIADLVLILFGIGTSIFPANIPEFEHWMTMNNVGASFDVDYYQGSVVIDGGPLGYLHITPKGHYELSEITVTTVYEGAANILYFEINGQIQDINQSLQSKSYPIRVGDCGPGCFNAANPLNVTVEIQCVRCLQNPNVSQRDSNPVINWLYSFNFYIPPK